MKNVLQNSKITSEKYFLKLLSTLSKYIPKNIFHKSFLHPKYISENIFRNKLKL